MIRRLLKNSHMHTYTYDFFRLTLCQSLTKIPRNMKIYKWHFSSAPPVSQRGFSRKPIWDGAANFKGLVGGKIIVKIKGEGIGLGRWEASGNYAEPRKLCEFNGGTFGLKARTFAFQRSLRLGRNAEAPLPCLIIHLWLFWLERDLESNA